MGAPAVFRLFALTRHGPNPIAGLRAHPHDASARHHQLSYWRDYARLVEANGFDGLWLADHLVALADGAPLSDASYLVPALAAATDAIGFVVTQPTSWHQPYPIARKLSTLDHLTAGRLGFSIDARAASAADDAFGLRIARTEVERRERTREFLAVLYKLFEQSWDDDALVADKARRIFVDPDHVHDIGHQGSYFSVPGVHLVDPTPQRTPLVAIADTPEDLDVDLAGTHAELVLLRGPDLGGIRSVAEQVRAVARNLGRRAPPLVIAEIRPVAAATDAEALATYHQIAELAAGALPAASGPGLLRSDGATSNLLVGSGARIADEIRRLAAEAELDGIAVSALIEPRSLADFATHALPHLRAGGAATPVPRTLRRALFGSDRLEPSHPGRLERRAATPSVHARALEETTR
jgi:alkanesulfonate monooxygenase SsuD/methylene tetrahydromethanopterin reductase-like flavin-dependent oxidoreductase (luciferase family)